MARGKAHSDETRAEVVAALLAGMGVREVARKYQIDPAFVSRVKQNLEPELKQVETESRARIDDLLLGCVRSNLEAMAKIATVAGETNYIQAQKACDIAALYREMSNTALDIIEAASAAGLDGGITEPGLPEVSA